jgi:aminoglycoside/choline kinase family phosphotransferase
MGERLAHIRQWLHEVIGLDGFEIEPASSDASFRRYFRVRWDGMSRIVMDAPPDREDCSRFVAVARAFAACGLNVPRVLAEERTRGFLLLTDLGTRLYLQELDESSVERLYGDALGALARLQACGPDSEALLPPYDRKLLMQEMALFRDWFLQRHIGVNLGSRQRARLEECFEVLTLSALQQPVVCVHRDYHSRNLMVTGRHNPGILDFQDAVRGPVTYDLVSLLRDCYIAWPRARVEEWALGYHELALQSGILQKDNEHQFLRWFDLMGVQRHLKAIGIFARLNHRDHKPGYLGDIPRTLGYVYDVAHRYGELQGLVKLLHELQSRERWPKIPA